MNRRTLLQGACSAGSIGLAGCTGLLEGDGSTDDDTEAETDEGTDDGSTVIATSFEGAQLPRSLTVDSQANAPPVALTGEHAHSGVQALRLASRPGTSSRVIVTTSRSVPNVSAFEAAVHRLDAPTDERQLSYPTVGTATTGYQTGDIVTAGDEHSMALELRDTDSAARVKIGINRYFGQVRLRTFDAAENTDATHVERVASTPVADGWHALSLSFDGETAVARIDDRSASAPIPDAFGSGDITPVIAANAWGNGDEIAVAVDDVVLTVP